MVEQEAWVSIREDLLPQVLAPNAAPGTVVNPLIYYVAHDVVYFPMRGETYEILYVAPSDTFRPRFYLARLNPDTGPPTDLLPDP